MVEGVISSRVLSSCRRLPHLPATSAPAAWKKKKHTWRIRHFLDGEAGHLLVLLREQPLALFSNERANLRQFAETGNDMDRTATLPSSTSISEIDVVPGVPLIYALCAARGDSYAACPTPSALCRGTRLLRPPSGNGDCLT